VLSNNNLLSHLFAKLVIEKHGDRTWSHVDAQQAYHAKGNATVYGYRFPGHALTVQ
jgi:hypothetical protein